MSLVLQKACQSFRAQLISRQKAHGVLSLQLQLGKPTARQLCSGALNCKRHIPLAAGVAGDVAHNAFNN